MKIASLRGSGLHHDNIFDIIDKDNRDNCYEPYILLQQNFLKHGIELHTADVNAAATVDFEIHLNATSEIGPHAYLLKMETDTIHPMNGTASLLAKYQKIFTWDDTLVDNNKFIKINYANPWTVPSADGSSHRDRFCCLIAGNKAVRKKSVYELYSERVRSIRWFENNAPSEFDLYGIGWDHPPAQPGILGRVITRLTRVLPRLRQVRPFPSYRGKIANKQDVLRRTKFALCYENVRDLHGYITEKIFDCFFSGCVPVYWGAQNIEQFIPSHCFIDRRKFRDTGEVYRYLHTILESDYIKIQQNIIDYLKSEKAHIFASPFFVETIVSHIVRDRYGKV